MQILNSKLKENAWNPDFYCFCPVAKFEIPRL